MKRHVTVIVALVFLAANRLPGQPAPGGQALRLTQIGRAHV
jgi:hypothetical protein